MDLFSKALRLAEQLAKKGHAVDPSAAIRSALGAAGLMGADKETASVGSAPGIGCFAPAGLTKGLDAFRPAPRRAKQPATAPADGGTFAWHGIVGAWGERRYRLFVPGGGRAPRGLVVMLHGCSQNPDDFAAGTGMNALAAANDLLVAYPEQPRSANPSGCWNWFVPADQMRGQGEPALIAAITRAVTEAHGLSPGRCFVAGLSAGGAMAAIMSETYPDLYAAVGIHSGLPYQAATDMGSAFAAMQGTSVAPAPPPPGATPPLIVFHGDADRTVHPSNADALLARFAAGRPGLRRMEENGASTGGQRYRRTIASDAGGAVRLEDWRLAGGGHAWSGGRAAGSYTDPAGVDASREMVRFFLAQANLVPAAA